MENSLNNQTLSSHSSTPKGLPQASRGFAEFQRNVTPNGSTFLQEYSLSLLMESILVGIYCILLLSILQYFGLDYFELLFILGFSKHFLGYILGLHSLYCTNGASCKGMNYRDTVKCPGYEKKIIKPIYKFLESIVEGFVFLFLGFILQKNGIKNKYLIVFFIGVFLHMFSEFIGLHSYFCVQCRNGKIDVEEKLHWLNSV